jgi:microcin C transport system permease protein
MVINFIVIQIAPGGPVEQAIAELTGEGSAITDRITRGGGETLQSGGKRLVGPTGSSENKYRGAQGLDPEFIKELEVRFGFDKPIHIRFIHMMKNYIVFDFGDSFFRDRKVVDLVIDKMPVSISLGIWTTLLVYGTAIPSFLFAVFLLVVFSGGSYLDWFPLAGLTSENWDSLSWPQRIVDYFWHLALPITAMTIGGFATLTMLTKNSFLDQINQQYVLTARAKGLDERQVMYRHVFRNAMLIVIAGFPAAFISILFTGSLLIEIIFSLDGLGLLGFEAAFNRDYPVMFGTLFFFSLLGLVMNLVGDITYTVIDPRIDFEARQR